jgi:hypothetical protein
MENYGDPPPNQYYPEEPYISSSDSENDLFKKFPVSSSESESELETKQVIPKRHLKRGVRRTLKRYANAGIEAVNSLSKTRRRLNQNADDRRVQAREDIKYARRLPDLRNFQALATYGQSELDQRGIYKSLLQKIGTNGNTVYKNMTLYDEIKPPKFELVIDFLELNFLENIYLIVVKIKDSGEEVRIPVTGYSIESVIQNGDDPSSFFSFTDIAFFPYEMDNGKLVAMPTYAKRVLNLNKMRDDIGVIAEIGENFPYTTIQDPNGILIRTWQWKKNIANRLAREAIIKNLTRIVQEEIKRPLKPDEQVRLYKYNLETGTKENLKVLEKQGPLSSLNVMELLSQFTFGSNVTNREDFLGKIHKLENLPLTKEAKATNLQQNMLVNQWAQQWQPQMPIGEGAAVNEPVRVQTEQQKAMAAARLAAFGNLGGSLHRHIKTKNKRSKKHRKTKKYKKRSSNKSKKQKR